MIRCIALLIAVLFTFGHTCAQAPSVPVDSIQLKNIKGKVVYFGDLVRKDPIVLVCFWSLGNDASIEELNAIQKKLEGWNKMAKFRLIPICVDEGSQTNRMRPVANENGWTFDVYADINMDLQHLLGFASAPQSMVVQNGHIVYQQSGFTEGSENYLFNKILAISPVRTGPLH